MKYYKITCIKGHCGRGNNNREITFGIEAENLIQAQDKAKRMPAVKHSKGILYGCEISHEEYKDLIQRNAYRVANGTRYHHINKHLT